MRNVFGKFVAVVALCVTGTFSAEKGDVPSIDLLKASADSIAAADSVAVTGSVSTDSLPVGNVDSLFVMSSTPSVMATKMVSSSKSQS